MERLIGTLTAFGFGMQDRRHRRVDCRAVLGHGRRCELPGPFGHQHGQLDHDAEERGQRRSPLGPEHQRDGRNVRARALDHRAFRPGADHRQLQRRQGDRSERGQGGRDRLDRVRTARRSLRGARSAPASSAFACLANGAAADCAWDNLGYGFNTAFYKDPLGVVHLKGVVSPRAPCRRPPARSTRCSPCRRAIGPSPRRLPSRSPAIRTRSQGSTHPPRRARDDLHPRLPDLVVLARRDLVPRRLAAGAQRRHTGSVAWDGELARVA